MISADIRELIALSPSVSRFELETRISAMAEMHGHPMSKARADKLARKIRRGDFGAALAMFPEEPRLHYADNTGDEAAANLDGDQWKEHARSFVRPPR